MRLTWIKAWKLDSYCSEILPSTGVRAEISIMMRFKAVRDIRNLKSATSIYCDSQTDTESQQLINFGKFSAQPPPPHTPFLPHTKTWTTEKKQLTCSDRSFINWSLSYSSWRWEHFIKQIVFFRNRSECASRAADCSSWVWKWTEKRVRVGTQPVSLLLLTCLLLCVHCNTYTFPLFTSYPLQRPGSGTKKITKLYKASYIKLSKAKSSLYPLKDKQKNKQKKQSLCGRFSNR